MKLLQFCKKYKLYLAETLIFLALLLCGLFAQKEVVLQAGGGSLQEGLAVENGETVWYSEKLALEPGVYRFRVEAKIPDGQSLVLSWENSEERIFRSVLTNERVLQGPQSDFGGKITITARVEQLRLKILYRGTAIGLENLEVEKTGQLYLVGAVCFLLVATGLNLLLYLRRLVVEKKITGRQQGAMWAIMAIVVVAAFPNLTDYITVSGSTMEYLTGGKNLFLLIPAFFRTLGFTVQTSWQLFVWIVTIFTTVFTYVCLSHVCEDGEVALLGTAFYMLTPYRGYCFYVLGDVDIWLGISFLPCLVCGLATVIARIFRLQKEKKNSGVPVGGIVRLVVGLAGFGYCILCHAGEPRGGGQMILAVGSMVATYLVCRLVQKIVNKRYRNMVIVLLAVIVVCVSLYQMNDLAFYLSPVYLYDLGL